MQEENLCISLIFQELYEGEDGENGFESDSEHELSDEEYLDLSRLLEPICELRQLSDGDDEDDDNDIENHNNGAQPQRPNLLQSTNLIAQLMQNNVLGMPLNEEQLRLQIQLQMQLQHHLLQLQANNEKQQNLHQQQRQHQQKLLPKPPNHQQKTPKKRNKEKTLSLRKWQIEMSKALKN